MRDYIDFFTMMGKIMRDQKLMEMVKINGGSYKTLVDDVMPYTYNFSST